MRIAAAASVATSQSAATVSAVSGERRAASGRTLKSAAPSWLGRYLLMSAFHGLGRAPFRHLRYDNMIARLQPA